MVKMVNVNIFHKLSLSQLRIRERFAIFLYRGVNPGDRSKTEAVKLASA